MALELATWQQIILKFLNKLCKKKKKKSFEFLPTLELWIATTRHN